MGKLVLKKQFKDPPPTIPIGSVCQPLYKPKLELMLSVQDLGEA